MSITHSVVNRQLERLVAESDPRAWKETLAVLCTYATTDEFAPLCDALAARLRGAGRDERSATLCYICAGNVDRTVQIWLEQVRRRAPARERRAGPFLFARLCLCRGAPVGARVRWWEAMPAERGGGGREVVVCECATRRRSCAITGAPLLLSGAPTGFLAAPPPRP